MKSLIAIFLLSLFFQSCSSWKSGQYVYVENPKDVPKIAKKYGVTVEELKSVNPDQSFRAGEWLFIPSKVGIAHFFQGTTAIEDYSHLGTGRFMWPVPHFTKVSSHFGKRGRKHHDGIDIPAPIGTPIVASDSGVVIYSDNKMRGYGNLIIIAHDGELYSVYAHNDDNFVDKGDKVKRGQKIAEVGNTGRSSGPHLHFEIRVRNKPRDPANYLGKKN